jgi:hypothetical protein
MIPLSLILFALAGAWLGSLADATTMKLLAMGASARMGIDFCAWLWNQAYRWTKGGGA